MKFYFGFCNLVLLLWVVAGDDINETNLTDWTSSELHDGNSDVLVRVNINFNILKISHENIFVITHKFKKYT